MKRVTVSLGLIHRAMCQDSEVAGYRVVDGLEKNLALVHAHVDYNGDLELTFHDGCDADESVTITCEATDKPSWAV